VAFSHVFKGHGKNSRLAARLIFILLKIKKMTEIASERKIALRSIVESQMELLRLSLYVATQGPAVYLGKTLKCTLSEAKQKTSQQIAMCAGQSVHTILNCADWRGVPVRDLYPIARSAVESFINAAFLLVEDGAVAERAMRWVTFRAWKLAHRAGRYTLRKGDADKSASAQFSEFSAFKNSDWTSVKVPIRAERVAEISGKRCGYRLLAAYDLIYPLSSEVIHGSPFGVNFFYQAHLPPNPTVEDFRQATDIQVEDLLIAWLMPRLATSRRSFGRSKCPAHIWRSKGCSINYWYLRGWSRNR
jgi:Family of unknown function (DUF5677)